MKAKHTEGEWSAIEQPDCSVRISATTKTNHKLICTIETDNAEQDKANAQLISAAPELLEAAKLCNREFDDSNDTLEAFKKLSKAIAKAEGK